MSVTISISISLTKGVLKNSVLRDSISNHKEKMMQLKYVLSDEKIKYVYLRSYYIMLGHFFSSWDKEKENIDIFFFGKFCSGHLFTQKNILVITLYSAFVLTHLAVSRLISFSTVSMHKAGIGTLLPNFLPSKLFVVMLRGHKSPSLVPNL